MPDSVGDELADTSLVPIALGDDVRAEVVGQGIDLEVSRGAFDLVDQTQHVIHREATKPFLKGAPAPPRVRERREQPIERAVLAEEQEFVLAREVVVEVRC